MLGYLNIEKNAKIFYNNYGDSMKIVNVDDSIFREYDVRAIYGDKLNKDVAYTIGRAFASYIDDDEVIVGYDNRTSSRPLFKALTQGLTDSGCNVINLGLVTTPMYYFAKKKYTIKNGIMITASHNPKEYNGFKISFDYFGNAYGNYIKEFKKFIDKKEYKKGQGKIEFLDIKNEYIKNIEKSINLGERKLRVVVDCGNGTASTIIKDVMSKFNVDVDYLYCKSDPKFPNHQPDPAEKKNQIDLANRVVKLGYDFGFSVDGDADRVGIVDEKGNIYLADMYLLFMYKTLPLKDKRAIYDVKCSKTLIDELNKLHYKHEMYRTGNSYMNIKINKDNYLFGGEFSGHVWFRDKYPGFDDGIYAGLRVLEILSHSKNTLSSYFEGINKYYSTEEIKVPVTDENKFDIVSKVKEYCDSKNYKYNDIDGIRVLFDDSWALVRASNTGPNLTLRFEAKTEDRLKELEKEFRDLIDKLK